MADGTTHNNDKLMAEIAAATAPLAQWLATGETGGAVPRIASDFVENAEDTRKKGGITATFERDQKKPSPETTATAPAENTPQTQRRRRHRQLSR